MTTPLTLDLALQGGGSRGIALNAAVIEILRRGHIIRRLVGTSAGAIVAAVVAAGLSVDELLRMGVVGTPDDLSLLSECVTEPLVPVAFDVDPVISEAQLTPLKLPAELGRRLLSAHAALGFVERGGFISGEGFVGWLMRVLEGKERGLSRVTLGELHARTGCHLTVIVTDTTARRLRALNHVSSPDCPLVSAVRMSISIPLFFTEVVWRAEWGSYAGEDLTGHVMVDGGVLSNLPIVFVMPSTNALVTRLMGPSLEGAAIPVGLVLDTTLEVPGAPPAPRTSSALGAISATRLGRRITALADTMVNGMDLTVSDTASLRLCRLPVKGYGVTEFDMTQARADALANAATVATATYLDELEARSSEFP
ncbi:MAG: patatin-like phospholipase family protein [Polyangiaceae bacterium]|jgi:predicted acylesterase/phospholipase RssA